VSLPRATRSDPTLAPLPTHLFLLDMTLSESTVGSRRPSGRMCSICQTPPPPGGEQLRCAVAPGFGGVRGRALLVAASMRRSELHVGRISGFGNGLWLASRKVVAERPDHVFVTRDRLGILRFSSVVGSRLVWWLPLSPCSSLFLSSDRCLARRCFVPVLCSLCCAGSVVWIVTLLA
jgi:hypothetical protein